MENNNDPIESENKKQRINPQAIYLTILVGIISAVSLTMFFIGLFREGIMAAFYVAIIYIVAMILIIIGGKIFLAKIEKKTRLDLAHIIMIFDAVLIMVIMLSIGFAFPALF